MSRFIVEASQIGISYRRTRHKVPSLKQTAIETIRRRIDYEDFFALRDISFTLSRGEILSIIGGNGAGKSTLLKTLARVLPPTTGKVIVRGDIAPMIELGAGFNPELTGAENILLYGALLGRSINHMKSRIEEIANWAGLSEHLDVPVRAYSSGMVARLAFATATDTTPDLLLIDEVLSVGDAEFREKSSLRTQKLIESGCAVLIVSHDLEIVQKISTKALYLKNGQASLMGDPKSVVNKYLADVTH